MNGLLALAFAAGLLAPINPCGFALLPAWVTYSLGDRDASPMPVRLARGARAGLALTIGFAGTLALAGLIVSAGVRALISVAPWLGLATGILLLVLGVLTMSGSTIRLRLPAIPPRPRSTSGSTGLARMVLFGVGYAAASLSCTFGVLLSVIAQAQATANYTGLLVVFAAYTAGAAAILLLVSISTAAASATLTRHLTKLARHGHRITAAVLIATGVYLTWYWYPAATSDQARSGNRLVHASATASTWIQAHSTVIAALATAAVLMVIAAAIHHRLSITRHSTSNQPDSSSQTEHGTLDHGQSVATVTASTVTASLLDGPDSGNHRD